MCPVWDSNPEPLALKKYHSFELFANQMIVSKIIKVYINLFTKEKKIIVYCGEGAGCWTIGAELGFKLEFSHGCLWWVGLLL